MSDVSLRRRIERLSPHAREALAEQVSRLSTDAGGTQLVCWATLDSSADVAPDELLAFLRRSLPEHMVPARLTILDALPRLPNGKIDTAALPDEMPRSRASVVALPETEKERILASIWRDVLGADRIDTGDNFFELGGDSILSIQVVARARRTGLHLTPESVFESPTLRDLAAAASIEPRQPVRRRTEITSAPLSPIQAWFFEQPITEPHHWHQVAVLETLAGFDPARFENAVAHLGRRHDALRLTFQRTASGWTQQLGTPTDVVRTLHVPDLAAMRAVVHDACASTHLDTGPLLHALLLRVGHNEVSHVAIAVHHLAVDAVSWDILLADLVALYEDGAPRDDQPSSFLAACIHLADTAQKAGASAEGWTTVPDAPPLPVESDGPFTEGSAFASRAVLDAADTAALLNDAHVAYNTNVEDLLIAALARTIAGWSQSGRLRFGIERHGRDELFRDVDVSRTVGWLTSFFPLTLDLPIGLDPADVIVRTKEALRALPDRGTSYGLLRYGGPPDIASRLARQPHPEIVFNFGGRWMSRHDGSAPWRLKGMPFASRSPVNGRGYRFEINTWVADGLLHVEWCGSELQYHRDTIARLAAKYLDDVRVLVLHATTVKASGFTPADFPDSGLDQAALDRFLGGLGT